MKKWISLLASCTLAIGVTATSIVPFEHLGDAARHSEVVVLAKALYAKAFKDDKSIYEDMEFQVVSPIKGALEVGQFFKVRPLSKQVGDFYLDIAGDFAPEAGKTYLLFLYGHNDVWRPQLLSYYVFEEQYLQGQSHLMPLNGMDGTEVLARPDGLLPEPLVAYRTSALLPLLATYAKGAQASWDAGQAVAKLPVATERAIPVQCDFSLGNSSTITLARWKNSTVKLYYDDTNAPANFTTTLGGIIAAMNRNYPGLKLSNGGSTPYTPDCGDGSPISQSDFVAYLNNTLGGPQNGLIMFEDPCNEIPPVSNCAGTLAYGGSYRLGTSSNHLYKGDIWQNCGFGYLVVNNGVPTCLPPASLSLMFIHEISHCFRLDHISPTTHPNHNMNPFCCNTINTGDLECMNYAYDAALLPIVLGDFHAQAQDKRAVLTWTTESEYQNSHFLLERSGDGTHFAPLARVDATNKKTGDRYQWTDADPLPGLNYYRLAQVDLDGSASVAAIRSLRFEGIAPRFAIGPNPVTAGATVTLQVSTAQTWDGIMEIIGSDGKTLYAQSLSYESGTHLNNVPTEGLAAGLYRVVLRQQGQATSATNLVVK